MDEQMRKATLDAMAELVEASAEHAVNVWEGLSEDDRANVPPEVRERLLALLARTEELAPEDELTQTIGQAAPEEA